MRRNRWLMAWVASFALVAGACGGDGDGQQPEGAEDLPDLAGQSVEVLGVWTGDEQTAFEAVLDQFNQETGANATFTSTGEDIATVLGTRIQGGNPPGIAMIPQPGLIADLVEQDALTPLDDIVGEVVDENFASVWREFGSVDGTLYGVWFKAANKSTFWYNLHVFEAAGVEPPASWDELQSVAQTVSDSGVTPFSIGGADGWTLSDWFENVYIRVAGPDAYDQLTNHEIPWDDQTVKDTLSELAKIWGNEEWIAGGTSGALQTDFPTSVNNVFANPQSPDAGMVYEADFVATVINNETESRVGEDADFFDFPAIGDSPTSVVSAGDAAVLVDDTEAGRALIQYLATPEAAEIRAQGGGFTSANQNMDLGVYPDEATRRSAEALLEADENVRFDLSDLQPAEFGSTAGQGIWGGLQELLRNPDDVDAVTRQLEQEATQAFG
jgi:alpha-glucoside transport system substrate-binding protein